VISPTQRLLPDNTQQTNIHASGGIRTHNPNKRAAADPLLRPYGRWDPLPATLVACNWPDTYLV